MSDERDKWADLFGDSEEGGDAALSGGTGAPPEGDEYVDPGPPEPSETRDHDVTPPSSAESGELTDEFAVIENRFLNELEEEEGGEAPAEEPPPQEPAEEPPAEKPPAEEPPAEEPPAEEPPAGEPPAEEPPAEEPPAEEPPEEEPPVVDPQPTQESLPLQPAAAPPPPPTVQPTTEAQRSLAATVEALSKEQIDDRKPAPLWTRFLAGSIVIVMSMATATAVSLLLYLTDIADGLADHSGELEGVPERLAGVDGGEPQTILILGSDIRPDIEEKGRSDTAMLLRLDPDRDAISLFSLPRDLKVNIPGVGIDKLNAAYSYGGPKKTLEVVKQITGLDINHLVNVNFKGFAKAVDAIDCVYVDVDRDYFHSNEGLAVSEQFSEIDVSAGYQRLCGLRALQFVRYRHTDNDIVRSARQQDFLREARQKVPPSRLFSDRKELIEIFTDHTTSDIDDAQTMLEVLKLFIEARGAPINQIQFEGGFEETYVTASNSQMKRAVKEFLGETGPASGPGAPPDGGKGKGKGKKGKRPKPQDTTAMVESGAETLAFVELMARRKRMPSYLPTRIAPGSFFDDESRGYQIRLPSEKFADAYKLVFQVGGRFGVPEYYGVMATEWSDPPILENPSETRKIDGREYMLFYDSGRLRMVGFKTNKGAYWVSNTLLQSLPEEQMMAIATAMREVKS